MAIRRRHSVLFARSDKLFTRLRAARLDNTVDAEIRRLTAIEILIIDDFALRPLDATETSDFYELIVERHRKKTTIVTSAGDLGDGAAGIDHPTGGLDLVFGRERPAFAGHADILPAEPSVPLSRCPPSGVNLKRTRPGTVDDTTNNEHPQ
jgi:hypothetical protein